MGATSAGDCVHTEAEYDRENEKADHVDPDHEGARTTLTGEHGPHRIRSPIENRQNPVQCRRGDLRYTPHRGADHDLEDQHIKNDTAGRLLEDRGERRQHHEEADGVMNVEKNHVSGLFA